MISILGNLPKRLLLRTRHSQLGDSKTNPKVFVDLDRGANFLGYPNYVKGYLVSYYYADSDSVTTSTFLVWYLVIISSFNDPLAKLLARVD